MNNGINKNAVYWLLLLSFPILLITLVIAITANKTKESLDNYKLSDGKSAYELAVDAGFVGSESDWLQFIMGEDGETGKSAYDLAVENGFEGTVEEWLNSLTGRVGENGEDKLSDYEIAVSNGFTGTLDQFLALIDVAIEKDAKGEDGEDGEDGISIVDIDCEIINGYEEEEIVAFTFLFSDGSINRKYSKIEKEIDEFVEMMPPISALTTNPIFACRVENSDGTTTYKLLSCGAEGFDKFSGSQNVGIHSIEFKYENEWEDSRYEVFDNNINYIPGGGVKGRVNLGNSTKYVIDIQLENEALFFPFIEGTINDTNFERFIKSQDIYGYVYEMDTYGNVTCTYRKLEYQKDFYFYYESWYFKKYYDEYENKTTHYYTSNSFYFNYRYSNNLNSSGNKYIKVYFYDPENIEVVDCKLINKRCEGMDTFKLECDYYPNKEEVLRDYASDLYIKTIYSNGETKYEKVSYSDIICDSFPTAVYSDGYISIKVEYDKYKDYIIGSTYYGGEKNGTGYVPGNFQIISTNYYTKDVYISNGENYKGYYTIPSEIPMFKYKIAFSGETVSSNSLYVVKNGSIYTLPDWIEDFEYVVPITILFSRYSSYYPIVHRYTYTFDEFIELVEIDGDYGTTKFFTPSLTYKSNTYTGTSSMKINIISSDTIVGTTYEKHNTYYHKTPYSNDPLEFACVKRTTLLIDESKNINTLLYEDVLSLRDVINIDNDAILNPDEIEIDEYDYLNVFIKGSLDDDYKNLEYIMFKRPSGSSILDLTIEPYDSYRYSHYECNEFEVNVATLVDDFLFLDLISKNALKYVYEYKNTDTKSYGYSCFYLPIEKSWVNMKNVPIEKGRFTTSGRYEFIIKLGVFDLEIKGYINVVDLVDDKEPIYTYIIDNDEKILKTGIMAYSNQTVDQLVLNLYDNNVISIDYIKDKVSVKKELHLYEIRTNMIILSKDQYNFISLPFVISGDDLILIEHDDVEPNLELSYDRNTYDIYFLDNNICLIDINVGSSDNEMNYYFYEYNSILDEYIIYTKPTIFTRCENGEFSNVTSFLKTHKTKLIWG